MKHQTDSLKALACLSPEMKMEIFTKEPSEVKVKNMERVAKPTVLVAWLTEQVAYSHPYLSLHSLTMHCHRSVIYRSLYASHTLWSLPCL
jgi:hypothetical protein